MTKEEIFNTVKDITADELDVSAEKITLETHIQNDLNADSLDVFEIMNELEDKFDIELDDDDAKVETIGDVVDYVAKKLPADK
ncbi:MULTISPECIES: acyl carrier protein [Limosilactobacillus]|jgi:acyl carrier protein|uniref:Acyl carrier protein n=4 Tax=Limosilactobacillus TaxID=2742598 RepID=A0A7W3TYC6_9LACO|nr:MULTISPECIES: acyl carrier protein [Limosilactobacillus]EEJ40504.1 putative acyl carrier protein [Limosilactobacillus vaginalis DSM 5837 = ATCC 49540]KRM48495.1 acyl carrier protein [Limosilactobacillus vaginalis DSM 5837 = ATCC 49540]MBB1062513.1 acyl carrier protein [Limosilactobacillus fastidiosus]MBB1085536.1 acyl carrier protein [Limosilactobacillus fastidiosus]MBD7894170.1 acyl carrier protein [Limosilactobacillus avistercoris]